MTDRAMRDLSIQKPPFRPTTFFCIALTGFSLLSGCALPRGAATPNEVLRGTDSETSNVHVIAVTRASLDNIRQWPRPAGSVRYNWPSAGAQTTGRTIRTGDTVAISIWDSQPDSLITTAEQRMVNMQNVVVSPSGQIFVPYVGEVRVSGQTADAARRDIEQQMRAIVPDGQVQLSVTPGAGNSIDVVSGVARPGRVAVPELSSTILSVLAEAGGINPTLRNPLVRLNRAGTGYAIPATTLYAEPQRDIVLRGGDRILVEEDQRNFIVLGAAGRQQVVYFEREDITALDALSSVGGLVPQRANLQGLMVLREYPLSAVRAFGNAPRRPSVIFTFEMNSAEGLFAASNFLIGPGDVILATESPVPAFTQVVGMFQTIRNLE